MLMRRSLIRSEQFTNRTTLANHLTDVQVEVVCVSEADPLQTRTFFVSPRAKIPH